MPVRNMKVRMFYTKEAYKKKKTPQPFCEFRVWIITEDFIPFKEKVFDRILDRLEYAFFSLRKAREEGAVFFIEGKEENRIIDEDEALIALAKTGLRRPKFGEHYRQVQFWLKRGRHRVYNEAEIRAIVSEFFDESKFRYWRRKMLRENRFLDDIHGQELESVYAFVRETMEYHEEYE